MKTQIEFLFIIVCYLSWLQSTATVHLDIFQMTSQQVGSSAENAIRVCHTRQLQRPAVQHTVHPYPASKLLSGATCLHALHDLVNRKTGGSLPGREFLKCCEKLADDSLGRDQQITAL